MDFLSQSEAESLEVQNTVVRVKVDAKRKMKDNKRAFRKEVMEKQQDVGKQGASKGTKVTCILLFVDSMTDD